MSVVEFSDLSPEKVSEVRRTIHHLMHKQFFYVPQDRPGFMRRVLDNPALRGLISRHFDVAGFDLIHSDVEGWYGLLPRIDEVISPRMTPTQTLVLFLLALHWQHCIENGDIDARANAVTGLGVLWQEFEERLLRSKSIVLKQEKLEELLEGDFSQKNIVSIGDYDADAADRPMLIRPFVRHLAGEDALTRLERFLAGQEIQTRPGAVEGDSEVEAGEAS